MRQKEPIPEIAEELYLRRQGRAIGRCGDEAPTAPSTSAPTTPAGTAASAAPAAATALSEEDLTLVLPDHLIGQSFFVPFLWEGSCV